MSDKSLTSMVLSRAERHGSTPAMLRKHQGSWQKVSWRQLGEQIVHVAKALAALGLRSGDRLAILAENRPEWAVADLACLFLGGVDVPLYLTSSTRDLTYILRDAGVRFVVVSGSTQRDRIFSLVGNLPQLSHVITLDEATPEGEPPARLTVVAYKDLLGQGEQLAGPGEPVATPGLATIMYTSGTTGLPKGVMLTHANMLANTEDATTVLPLHEGDLAVSFLPLSHGFERTAGLYTLLRAGVCIAYGGGPVTLTKDLGELRPTILCCVPRVLELVYRRVMGERGNATFLKRQLIDWTVSVGTAAGSRLADGHKLSIWLRAKRRLADRVLFQRLRNILGGRIRFVVSGGAPLNAEIARFFYGIGVTVYEGYGLTEAAPFVSCNLPGRTRLGTVGPPLPQVEVQIAVDGEICVRGPNVMHGYYRRPADTAQAIDADGWLHTGDVGHVDSDGYLTITDRKKDLIITSEAVNIAPQPIEALLRQDPLIEEACLIGDQRPFLTALLVPNRPLLQAAAKKQGLPGSWQALIEHPELRALFRRRVDQVNKTLPADSRVRKFTILAEPFSQESGELTPTLKLKRREVAAQRRSHIEAMYPSRTLITDPAHPQ